MTLNTGFTVGPRVEARSSFETTASTSASTTSTSPQAARVQMEGRGEVLILSSNNYLGLADEPSVVEAGIEALRPLRRGHGERAVHLRHVHDPPRARGRRSRGSSAPRRRCRTSRRGTRTRGSRRRSCEEGDFVVLRRAQPRVDHRLDPAREVDHEVHDRRVQARRPGRPAREARAARRAAKRRIIWTRRRVLDGGLDREAARPPADRARSRRDRS